MKKVKYIPLDSDFGTLLIDPSVPEHYRPKPGDLDKELEKLYVQGANTPFIIGTAEQPDADENGQFGIIKFLTISYTGVQFVEVGRERFTKRPA